MPCIRCDGWQGSDRLEGLLFPRATAHILVVLTIRFPGSHPGHIPPSPYPSIGGDVWRIWKSVILTVFNQGRMSGGGYFS